MVVVMNIHVFCCFDGLLGSLVFQLGIEKLAHNEVKIAFEYLIFNVFFDQLVERTRHKIN